MFGHTLMLAGLTRILEVCFFAPSFAADAADDDNRSEHTLADGAPTRPLSAKAAASRSFRFLPPFVRAFLHRRWGFRLTQKISRIAIGSRRVSSRQCATD